MRPSFPTLASNAVRSILAVPYSKLVIPDPSDNWSLSWDAKEVSAVCASLGFSVDTSHWAGIFRQVIFYVNKYFLLKPERHLHGLNRVTMAYYHGYPGADEITNKCLDTIRKCHHRISRIQITHQRISDVLQDCGVPADKLRFIPIGVNTHIFTPSSAALRSESRLKLGIPDLAYVVGSFQKDGVGWGEGAVPKLVKGPDILVKALTEMYNSIPELFVLLTGPSRGYVARGLAERGIPFLHFQVDQLAQLSSCYHALDSYLISSREEGGPKAVLESMACGIPVVSTPVGQATTLISSGRNGILASSFSPEELAAHMLTLYSSSDLGARITCAGLETARNNTYQSQRPLWYAFFEDLVAL